MFLLDTNIFLEILLEQDKSKECKDFLESHSGDLYISDFTFHSIEVILLRQNADQTFLHFIEDISTKVSFLSLPLNQYKEVVEMKKSLGLDLDDSYQYNLCKHFNLKLVTMDKDFKNIIDIGIHFL